MSTIAWPFTRCMSCRYVSNNPQYADAASYASKFRQLQQRAMATMRTKVAQVLQLASEQVSSQTIHCGGPTQITLP